MQIRWLISLVFILTVIVFFGGCTSTTSPPGLSHPEQSDLQPVQPAGSGALSLSIGSLSPGAALPDLYTCKGSMESPPVSWSGIPAGTESLVLIVEDPDAPNGLYTHWIVYNIPPHDGQIAQGQTNAKKLANGADQGRSSGDIRGYDPPCPPPLSTHRYIFRLYALDLYPALPTADRAAIDKVLADHTLAKAEFATTFAR